FHGWWRNTMIGQMSGFYAGGPSSALQDQYIYIDTSVSPVKIYTTYGTDRFPRLKPDVFDSRPVPLPCVPGVPTANSYFYKGPKVAEEITSQFLNGTFRKTTPLRKIRITNTAYYATIGIPNDTWTTIYTGNPEIDEGIFSCVTPGSNVTIEGATAALSILNGTYRNGIGLLNAGTNLGLKSSFVDKG